MRHLKIVSFTKGGDALGRNMIQKLNKSILAEHYARGSDPSLRVTKLSRFTQQAMYDSDALVFIGATGIAVRMIAPYLRGKAEDPAVIVLDEAGQYVIPLLSGHLGGANKLANYLAKVLGATPVLTTATDVCGIFAVDCWAENNGFTILETENIRYISAALLRGEAVGLQSDFPVYGTLPAGIKENAKTECGIVISCHADSKPFPHTLHLVPRIIVAGIGCRRGKSKQALEQAINDALSAQGIAHAALCGLASIDIKKDELGLLALSCAWNIPFICFHKNTLQNAPGNYTASDFVANSVGVDNVCERAAVCGAENGTLLCKKNVMDGITVAFAQKKLEVVF